LSFSVVFCALLCALFWNNSRTNTLALVWLTHNNPVYHTHCTSLHTHHSTDYLRAPPTQAAGQLLFFDQSRFDADADYFASEGAQKKKSPPKKTGPRAKRTDADSPLRVRFAPRLIAEVHYRDRVGYHEKAELFFTHNEEYQFTMDQSKEAERAEVSAYLLIVSSMLCIQFYARQYIVWCDTRHCGKIGYVTCCHTH
jgi:hypothetical protein